jgi:carbon monoxide dehydrogenase subunit G
MTFNAALNNPQSNRSGPDNPSHKILVSKHRRPFAIGGVVQKIPKYFALRIENATFAKDILLLKMVEELPLEAPIGEVWKLLRNTPLFAGLLPGVGNVVRMVDDGNEAYAAPVSEKIGPFKITMNLEVRVIEAVEPTLLKASLKGADSMGLNRVTGSMQVTLSAAPAGTQMHFEASIEVLGKLATLGAVPIRRRTTQAFAEFAKNIQRQFAGDPGSALNAGQ